MKKARRPNRDTNPTDWALDVLTCRKRVYRNFYLMLALSVIATINVISLFAFARPAWMGYINLFTLIASITTIISILRNGSYDGTDVAKARAHLKSVQDAEL